jgi:hypothetical protein
MVQSENMDIKRIQREEGIMKMEIKRDLQFGEMLSVDLRGMEQTGEDHPFQFSVERI